VAIVLGVSRAGDRGYPTESPPGPADACWSFAYLFGGYVAGRMARRAGLVNGLAVFALAVLLIVAVGPIAASQTDTGTVQANLRSLGLPITGTEWARIGTAAGIGTLVGMLVGAGIGGVVGERWHSELAQWAALGRGSPNHDQDDPDPASRPSSNDSHMVLVDTRGCEIGDNTTGNASWRRRAG
jgi:hypothetical protein